jgi:hypothetical protein
LLITNEAAPRLKISGIYPHLAVFNQGEKDICRAQGNECGIGAIVPWAGKLWLITYSASCPLGSTDKLYSIDPELNSTIHPDSVGGTHANRMIHKESDQLIIGPYFIDKKGKVRAIPPKQMSGRLTAVTRHLTRPADMVYFFAMEGRLYEANVHTLESKLLFEKPIPGWHGKGAYVAQNHFILANNGEQEVFKIKPDWFQTGGAAQNKEQKGNLAEWDGTNWSIVRRKQFTEVTGPGGLAGNEKKEDPAWSIGWDERSVILMLFDRGDWTEFRLPKATYTYDSMDGSYTEWPRIRAVGDKYMMHMHGLLYEFPANFSLDHIEGIKPICNNLLMITDFCEWRNEVVFSTNVTSMMLNKMAGQSQSNLWFGSWKDLEGWGPASGSGGVWLMDPVQAGVYSTPFLINGFDKKVVHLAHTSNNKVTFTLEIYKEKRWEVYKNISVASNGYEFHVFPGKFKAEWVRVKADMDCEATVFFHYRSPGYDLAANSKIFEDIAAIEDKQYYGAIIRAAAHNTNIQYVALSGTGKKNAAGEYYEVDHNMQFFLPKDKRNKEVMEACPVTKDFETDEASVIVSDKTGKYRIPRTHASYDLAFDTGWPRGLREVITERSLLNVHGTFYEVAIESGLSTIRPICTHMKRIVDFCSWRGMLVISGTKLHATAGPNYFCSNKPEAGLWFGTIDDLWKFGAPAGYGGPWKESEVRANMPSLPYLMTGYDKKKVELSADSDVVLTLEVNFDHKGWNVYKLFSVAAGRKIIHDFPEGYSADWVRVKSDKDTKATVQFIYT